MSRVGKVAAIIAVLAVSGAMLAACSSTHTSVTLKLPRLPALPFRTLPGGSSTDKIVLRKVDGVGDKSLPRFSPVPGVELYIQLSCAGGKEITVVGFGAIGPCTGKAESVTVPYTNSMPRQSKVIASKSIEWELRMTSG